MPPSPDHSCNLSKSAISRPCQHHLQHLKSLYDLSKKLHDQYETDLKELEQKQKHIKDQLCQSKTKMDDAKIELMNSERMYGIVNLCDSDSSNSDNDSTFRTRKEERNDVFRQSLRTTSKKNNIRQDKTLVHTAINEEGNSYDVINVDDDSSVDVKDDLKEETQEGKYAEETRNMFGGHEEVEESDRSSDASLKDEKVSSRTDLKSVKNEDANKARDVDGSTERTIDDDSILTLKKSPDKQEIQVDEAEHGRSMHKVLSDAEVVIQTPNKTNNCVTADNINRDEEKDNQNDIRTKTKQVVVKRSKMAKKTSGKCNKDDNKSTIFPNGEESQENSLNEKHSPSQVRKGAINDESNQAVLKQAGRKTLNNDTERKSSEEEEKALDLLNQSGKSSKRALSNLQITHDAIAMDEEVVKDEVLPTSQNREHIISSDANKRQKQSHREPTVDVHVGTLKRSTGRSREWLNSNLNFDACNFTAKFSVSSFGTHTKNGSCTIDWLVLNDEWNELVDSQSAEQLFYVGTGQNRKKFADAFIRQACATPLFHAPKKAERSKNIYYVGHWIPVTQKCGAYLEPIKFLGRERQQLISLKFDHFDEHLSGQIDRTDIVAVNEINEGSVSALAKYPNNNAEEESFNHVKQNAVNQVNCGTITLNIENIWINGHNNDTMQNSSRQMENFIPMRQCPDQNLYAGLHQFPSILPSQQSVHGSLTPRFFQGM